MPFNDDFPNWTCLSKLLERGLRPGLRVVSPMTECEVQMLQWSAYVEAEKQNITKKDTKSCLYNLWHSADNNCLWSQNFGESFAPIWKHCLLLRVSLLTWLITDPHQNVRLHLHIRGASDIASEVRASLCPLWCKPNRCGPWHQKGGYSAQPIVASIRARQT